MMIAIAFLLVLRPRVVRLIQPRRSTGGLKEADYVDGRKECRWAEGRNNRLPGARGDRYCHIREPKIASAICAAPLLRLLRVRPG
jgi:hypothetical protein